MIGTLNTDGQRNEEWFVARCGRLTASNASKVFRFAVKTDKKTKEKTIEMCQGTDSDYWGEVYSVATERLTGECRATYCSSAMQWGIDHEDEARDAYVAETMEPVTQTGFIYSETMRCGASPDGVICNGNGLIEIKCPNSKQHLQRIVDDVVPLEYRPQMIVQCLATGAEFVDYCDYDPRFKERALWIKRYEPTQDELDVAIAFIHQFNRDVDEVIEKFKGE